jgi:hypothetical protein
MNDIVIFDFIIEKFNFLKTYENTALLGTIETEADQISYLSGKTNDLIISVEGNYNSQLVSLQEKIELATYKYDRD